MSSRELHFLSTLGACGGGARGVSWLRDGETSAGARTALSTVKPLMPAYVMSFSSLYMGDASERHRQRERAISAHDSMRSRALSGQEEISGVHPAGGRTS